jgi:hypothetical protein
VDEESKKLLEENVKLSRENNRLLLKMDKINKWSFISKIIYWFILLGIAAGAFYFIQPLIDGVSGIYGI